MHFDPVGTEQTSQADIREFTEDDVLARQAREVVRDQDVDRAQADADVRTRAAEESEEDEEEREEDDELDVPSARKAREGLPARFRMRHTPHYVDELLGDAPPRTVREIPISEIESPIDDQAELADLEQSIRRLGIIEPLVIASRGASRGRRGAIYRVIAGMRRLRAAQRVGLGTVPCLVHDVHEGDEGRMTDLRDAAMQRLTVPPPDPEPVPEPVAAPAPVQPSREQTIGEAALGLEFVASLLPAMNAAGSDRLRWGVLTDLAAVELSRAKLSAAAEESLRNSHALDRASLDPRALVLEAVSAVATEARLRGVRVDVSAPDEGRDIFLDGARCRSALTGLLHALLALAPQGGTLLGVSAQITTIRPALIVACLLQEADPELSPEALGRFFEAGWREHPCGTSRAPILGAFAHTARAHGGRVDVKIVGKGCLVTFVVPRLEG